MATPPAASQFTAGRMLLLLAFAFAVMADPVSSVAYAIEAALRALDGDLGLLLPTMSLVIAIVVLVTVSYHQIIARFPEGGGAAAAVGEAFGEGWAFVPIGALMVDFALTIAISASAAASATIAYLPALAPWRVLLGVLVVLVVAGLSWFGHAGRMIFAAMTIAFIGLSVVVLFSGLGAHPGALPPAPESADMSGAFAVVLAFPVAMALATGVEAPASAIAQLGQLDDSGRRRFGQITLWLTVGIIGTVTLGLTAHAVHLGVGVPGADSTQIADLARVTVSPPLFAAFQFITALLLLSAASSSFQAGPGLLKALAAAHHPGESTLGILPAVLGRTNRHHTPSWGLGCFTVAAAALTIAAGGQDQNLVLFYAAAVFLSFLSGLLAMARLSHRDRRPVAVAVNLVGAAAVGFTVTVNLVRGAPLASMAAALLIAVVLHSLWIRAGRQAGVHHAGRHSQAVRVAPRRWAPGYSVRSVQPPERQH